MIEKSLQPRPQNNISLLNHRDKPGNILTEKYIEAYKAKYHNCDLYRVKVMLIFLGTSIYIWLVFKYISSDSDGTFYLIDFIARKAIRLLLEFSCLYL